MARRGAQLSLAAVAVIVGVLLIGQLRSQAPAIELAALSAQELTDVIETLSTGNAQLTAELTELRQRVGEYQRDDVEGRSSVTLLREDMVRFAAFAGTLPVEGQGIEMELEGALTTINVMDLIHELRSAGAEAIAIDDIRITASSVPVQGTATIEIDGVAIGNPIRVRAIGSPEGLAAALDRPGGVLSILAVSVGAASSIEERDHLELPPTERDLVPQVAQPVE
jgi:uncharacterized protein YlxW (UPF0749 family)